MRARTKGACLLQLEPCVVQAKPGELSESQAPQARQSTSPRHKRERRETTKTKLGHLRHTTSRGKGPGVGPVLGPRHEELADRVELRAQHVRPRVCITTAFPRRS